MKHTAERYHDISTGHRVVGHENKCRHLHGHNYRIHFVCQAQQGVESLDKVGRVIDFGVIKEKLCMWVENNWDHKFLAWEQDSVIQLISQASARYNNAGQWDEEQAFFEESIVIVPFNPTAENMAEHLVKVIGPQQLAGTGVDLVSVRIEETAKCSASFHT
jgi:6-pyruvoyltetrahydropterin/6-carboxytetrahydropterin synthase